MLEAESDSDTPPPARGEETPPAQPPAATPPVATPPVVAQPPAVQPPAEPPVVTPPVVAQPPAQPPAEPQAPKPKTPEQEAAERQAAEELLATRTAELETFYRLPEDLAGQMQTEPEVVLPKLAAKLHMAVREAVVQEVRRDLPVMFQGMQEVQRREAASKEAFYKANPDLTGYEPQVLQVGMFFRQSNPNATPDEAIERIGNMTRMALGLPPKAGGAPPPAAPSTAATPTRPAPFRPAAPGAAGPAAAPAPSGNPFEALAEEFLEEDRG
jgi:hypothetical protein